MCTSVSWWQAQTGKMKRKCLSSSHFSVIWSKIKSLSLYHKHQQALCRYTLCSDWVMLCCKDPRATYKQPDLPLRIQFLIMLYKLFSPEKSTLCKRLLMLQRLCRAGDIDMDVPQKFRRSLPRSQSQGLMASMSQEEEHQPMGTIDWLWRCGDTRASREWGREVECCRCKGECKGIGSQFLISWTNNRWWQQTCYSLIPPSISLIKQHMEIINKHKITLEFTKHCQKLTKVL